MAKGKIKEKQIEEAEQGRQALSATETYRRERNAPFMDAETKSAEVRKATSKTAEEISQVAEGERFLRKEQERRRKNK